MTEEDQPKRILSWMGLNKLQTYWEWKLKRAKKKGKDIIELEKRVNAIKEAKEKV